MNITPDGLRAEVEAMIKRRGSGFWCDVSSYLMRKAGLGGVVAVEDRRTGKWGGELADEQAVAAWLNEFSFPVEVIAVFYQEGKVRIAKKV